MNMNPHPLVPLMSERRVSLLGAAFVALGPVSMAIYTPAMPQIVEAFGTTANMVKLTLTLYFAGFAFAQLIAGPISDFLGRRPVILGFLAIYTLASIAALHAASVEMLIAARFIQGIGASAGIAVGRAIVRDLYVGAQSARIMNLIGIILALGPSLSPTIGGLLVPVLGWQSLFYVMTGMGIGSALMTVFFLRETVSSNPGSFRIASLLRSYGTLLTNPYFLAIGTVTGASSGAIFTLATFLPFVLMGQVGLTTVQFGMAMLMQTGSFFIGSLVARQLMRRFPAERLVAPGMMLIAIGATLMIQLAFHEPTLLRVMGPISFFSFGIGLAMPSLQTSALAPFASMAGAAAAMLGFMQMGFGFLMGSIGALFGDPRVAMATILPFMGYSAFVAWLAYRRMQGQDPG